MVVGKVQTQQKGTELILSSFTFLISSSTHFLVFLEGSCFFFFLAEPVNSNLYMFCNSHQALI